MVLVVDTSMRNDSRSAIWKENLLTADRVIVRTNIAEAQVLNFDTREGNAMLVISCYSYLHVLLAGFSLPAVGSEIVKILL